MNSQFDFIVGIGDDIDGVDLNRNYDFNWVFGDEYNQLDTGCSTNPSYLSNYDYYRGPYPFSESEVRAVRDFALENNFLLSVAYHSSRSGCVAEKVISPWLWEDEKAAPDLDVISELGVQIAERIPSEDGLGYYYPGNSISMRGNAHDWFYKETGCIQYLIEVGSSNMQPDNVELIESTISHNMQGLMHLLKRGAGSNVQNGPDVNQVSGIVTNSSGDPIVAKVEIVELSGPMLTDRYTDSFGRFRRLLGQDSYSIIVSAFGYENYYGVVSSTSNSITEISIVLNELPKYNINLDFTNSIAANYTVEVRGNNNIDFITPDSEVLNLEYPSGEYEIMITSDISYPKLLSFNLNENIDFNLSINCNCLLVEEDFENLNNWNISSSNFFLEDSKLLSQNGSVYSSNLDSYMKSTIDLSAIKKAMHSLGKSIRESKKQHVILVKSTVVPGTMKDVILPILENNSKKKAGRDFGLISNPEFLQESTAIRDTKFPHAVVLGGYQTIFMKKTKKFLTKLHPNTPIIITNHQTAEMIKYANNSFLATKISFINQLSNICQNIPDADVDDVASAIGLDPRIGKLFLNAGPGYGGSCLPKDMSALINFGSSVGANTTFLKAVKKTNDEQINNIISLMEKKLGSISNKKITILGTAFKPNTNDIRDSKSIELIKKLLKNKVKISVYDPKALENTKMVFGNKIIYSKSLISALDKSYGVIIMTQWKQFESINNKSLQSMKNKLIIDSRRMLANKELNGEYYAIGIGEKQ